MLNLPCLSSVWKLAVIVCALVLSSGSWHSARGQGPDFDTKIARLNRSPNPKVNLDHTASPRTGNRSPKASREAEKQQAIDQAIDAGNKARDGNDYQRALIQYEKVKALSTTEARAYYGLGNIYSDLSCNESAIDAYLNAIRLRKDFREARIALGYAYSRKDRYEDAETEFRSVLDNTPNDGEANVGLALMLSDKEKYREAIDQLKRVIDNQSLEKKDRAVAYVALGIVDQRQQNYELAIEHFQGAIKINPGLVTAYLWLGSSQLTFANSKLSCIVKMSARDLEELRASAQEATGFIEKAREIGISNGHDYSPPGLYLLLALGLTYQQRYDEALVQLKSYSERVGELERQMVELAHGCNTGLDELKAKGHYQVGYVYQFESKFESDLSKRTELLEKAIHSAELALKAKPDFAVAHFMLGNIYDSQNKNDEAIEEYTKAIVPSFPERIKATLYYKIGSEYGALGRNDEALLSYEEAVKHDPNEPLFLEAVASIYILRGDLDATFAKLNKAADLRTHLNNCAKPDPYYYLGATYAIRYLKNGGETDFAEAVNWLKKALAIRGDYAPAYSGLGHIYQKHLNVDEALASFDKAIKYDSQDPTYHFNMGRAYLELKQNDDAALKYLGDAIRLKPDYAEAHFVLGRAYHHKHADPEAIKQFQEAIRSDEKYVAAYVELADIFDQQRNYDEAVKWLMKATEKLPTSYLPYKEIANVYSRQHKNNEAIHYFEEANNRVKSDELWLRDIFRCRIVRLEGHYADAITCVGKLKLPEIADPGQIVYELGQIYVASGDKKAAQAQYEQLKRLKSSFADNLLRELSDMK